MEFLLFIAVIAASRKIIALGATFIQTKGGLYCEKTNRYQGAAVSGV